MPSFSKESIEHWAFGVHIAEWKHRDATKIGDCLKLLRAIRDTICRLTDPAKRGADGLLQEPRGLRIVRYYCDGSQVRTSHDMRRVGNCGTLTEANAPLWNDLRQ